VPGLFESEDQADLVGSAGGDAGGERDEFCGEMLGFDGPGTAVADDLELGVCGCLEEEGAGEDHKCG
jgi:hypothetical protein